MNEGANKGILVCTSQYGKDAYRFCEDKPIELIDGGGLLYLLKSMLGYQHVSTPFFNYCSWLGLMFVANV